MVSPSPVSWPLNWRPGIPAIKGSIKGPELSYTDDGNKPSGPASGQNVGYYDTLRHKDWHFEDIPFSTEERRLNLQIPLMRLLR